jgi:hypothetical protein
MLLVLRKFEKPLLMLDWNRIDRWIMGEASVGSGIPETVDVLCRQIGVRWAGTDGERAAAEFVADRLKACSLSDAGVQQYALHTADCHSAALHIEGQTDWQLDARPCLFCPSVNLTAPLVNVGFGMPLDLVRCASRLKGCVALIRADFEPFSEPRLLQLRLQDLAQHGVLAAIAPAAKLGRQLSHVSASDWRDDPTHVSIPLIQTSIEDAARLSSQATLETRVVVKVMAEFRTVTSWNSVGDMPGAQFPEDSLVLGAHHDTTPDSVGANDNAAGVAVLLETVRLLSGVRDEFNVHPKRTLRFASFGGEEQGLQGSTAFVERHYSSAVRPRLMLALDELATGNMKGVVLQFPELQTLVQQQLDQLHEGLQCHVLSQLDASGDMFPFTRQAIPSSFLWRWRFVGRHPETAFGHSSSDTPDKLRIRELKEYAGFLARLLLRLGCLPPAAWPENRLNTTEIAERIQAERGAVFRTM